MAERAPKYVDRLAKKENRVQFTSPEQEIRYLRERIEDAKGWMKLGLTHQLWGSIEDAYAALPPTTRPPVKRWRESLKRRTKR